MGKLTQRFLIIAMVGALGAVAGDWPHFMGPTRNHTSAEKGLIKSFNPAPTIAWRGSVGRGYSRSGFLLQKGF